MSATDAICLATMLDLARLTSLARILEAWPSELSAAVLADATHMIAGNIDEQINSIASVVRGRGTQVRVTLVEDTGWVPT